MKRCKRHEWIFIRKTNLNEYTVTRKQCYVRCKHCNADGYCNYKDLEWVGDNHEKTKIK